MSVRGSARGVRGEGEGRGAVTLGREARAASRRARISRWDACSRCATCSWIWASFASSAVRCRVSDFESRLLRRHVLPQRFDVAAGRCARAGAWAGRWHDRHGPRIRSRPEHRRFGQPSLAGIGEGRGGGAPDNAARAGAGGSARCACCCVGVGAPGRSERPSTSPPTPPVNSRAQASATFRPIWRCGRSSGAGRARRSSASWIAVLSGRARLAARRESRPDDEDCPGTASERQASPAADLSRLPSGNQGLGPGGKLLARGGDLVSDMQS